MLSNETEVANTLAAGKPQCSHTVQQTLEAQIEYFQEQIARVESLIEMLPQTFLEMNAEELREKGIYI